LHSRVAVLSAGMVGVATSLELQRLGAQIILIVRCDPGQDTSCGNAGVIARSALMPFTLRKALPALLRCRPAPAGQSEGKPVPAQQRLAVPLPQPGRRNLWLAFGHQYVGFSSDTGTARLLGALMSGQPAPTNARPFRAERVL
jgi:glycine/D-amino acid oxidase-like deaminating enzyme